MRVCGWSRIIVAGSTGMQQPIPNLALSNTLRASIEMPCPRRDRPSAVPRNGGLDT
jgi:hypothetical protein